MLRINAEMNMAGRDLQPKPKCWQSSILQITKMAIITHRVNIDGSVSRWFSFGVLQMVQFPNSSV